MVSFVPNDVRLTCECGLVTFLSAEWMASNMQFVCEYGEVTNFDEEWFKAQIAKCEEDQRRILYLIDLLEKRARDKINLEGGE